MNKSFLIIGSNGTGKTTFLVNNVVLKKKTCITVCCSSEKKYLVKGVQKVFYDYNNDNFSTGNDAYNNLEDVKKLYKKIAVFFKLDDVFENGGYFVFKSFCKHLLRVKNTNIIFDDLKYVIDNKVNGSLKSLFVAFKQQNCNAFAVYHSFNDIHAPLITHYHYTVIFKTTDNFLKKEVAFFHPLKRKADKMPDYTPFIAKI